MQKWIIQDGHVKLPSQRGKGSVSKTSTAPGSGSSFHVTQSQNELTRQLLTTAGPSLEVMDDVRNDRMWIWRGPHRDSPWYERRLTFVSGWVTSLSLVDNVEVGPRSLRSNNKRLIYKGGLHRKFPEIQVFGLLSVAVDGLGNGPALASRVLATTNGRGEWGRE